MAIIEMQKIRLLIHRGESSDVLRAVQKFGLVEFTEVKDEKGSLHQREKTAFEFNYVSGRLDFAVEFLSRYAPEPGFLKGAIEGTKVRASGTKIYQTAKSFYYNDIVNEAELLGEKINDSDSKQKALLEERALLSQWEVLKSPLSMDRESRHTKQFLVTSKISTKDAFEKELVNSGITYTHDEFDESHHSFICFKDDADTLEKMFQAHEYEIVTLPKRRGNPSEEIERIDRALKKEEERTSRLEIRARKLAKKLSKLKIVSDYIYWQKQKHNLISSSKMTRDTLVFEGWCPKKRVKQLRRRIENKTKNYALDMIDPAEDEVAPVEIENNRLITPFESITRLYGLPGPKDLDPTLFLAGFFFIFFGLSLTDVGYGIILFLATAAILFFYNVPRELKPMITLIMFGGIASTLIGLLFGGYLGIEMSYLPVWLQNLQQFDPIRNPIPVFYLALGFGVVQILFGLVLAIVKAKKNNELLDGILDHGPWIALFLAIGAWGANIGGVLSGPSIYYVYAIYAVVASLVLTQGRKEKNYFAKLAKGLLSLYDSISYFSDILSYSRLLALGLATSALAFAVNLIAAMVVDVPYVGFVLMSLILVVGHLFNLAVNVLGAFIHSARLQFVEFFGKFITETGRNFKPFKREERYVVISNK